VKFLVVQSVKEREEEMARECEKERRGGERIS
jgi:hypothetical protein